MSNAEAFRPLPVLALDPNTQIIDPRTGRPLNPLLLLFQNWRAYNLAGCRIIPCTASGKNLITLTPNEAHPLIAGYWNFDRFPFVADETSDGSVTAAVVPDNGTLATLKVYVSNGGVQAGAGDVVAGRLYDAVFSDHLDGGNGGLVLK